MNYSVTVLLTNGRRQRVPVKLNTPILMILEETCKKHKLNSNEYELKFHNRILDLTSTIQFCGIANNVQLELVPTTKSRIDAPITVFLQLENGERVSDSFLPSCTLWNVISKLCSEDIKMKENPVIIYTRQEVLGEKLKSTSLKMLGLTGGNALLRLLHRTEDQLRNQSVSSVYRLQPKPKVVIEEKLVTGGPELESNSKWDNETESKPVLSESPMQVENNDSTEYCLNKMDATNVQNEKKEMNVHIQMEEKKLIVDEKNVDNPSTSNEQELDFDINKVEFVGERYALIFNIHSIPSPRFYDITDDDDFYELTVDDAKTLLRDIKRTRSELEEADLETSTTKARKRSMLLERTLSIYPYCIIRVLFPNRIVLQGVFQSTESVLDVLNFTKSFIEVYILDFYLYTSPPKKILKPNEILIDIGAVPGINIYFGTDQIEHSPSSSFLQQRFLDKMVPPNVAFQVANHFRSVGRRSAREHTEITPITAESSENKTDLVSVSPTLTSIRTTPQPDVQRKPSGGKVPKWFKMK